MHLISHGTDSPASNSPHSSGKKIPKSGKKKNRRGGSSSNRSGQNENPIEELKDDEEDHIIDTKSKFGSPPQGSLRFRSDSQNSLDDETGLNSQDKRESGGEGSVIQSKINIDGEGNSIENGGPSSLSDIKNIQLKKTSMTPKANSVGNKPPAAGIS